MIQHKRGLEQSYIYAAMSGMVHALYKLSEVASDRTEVQACACTVQNRTVDLQTHFK